MKRIVFTLPSNNGSTVTLPYLGEASSAAELVYKLKRTQRIATCPACGRRLTWLGKVHSLCARCLQRRN